MWENWTASEHGNEPNGIQSVPTCKASLNFIKFKMKRDLTRCEEQYKTEARILGLEYIGASQNNKNHYRRYLLKCGHQKDLIPQNVRKNQVQCKQCIFEKFDLIEKSFGLTLIEKINRNCNLYRLNCGHTQSIYKSAILSGEWTCRSCNKTHFDLPSSLYLLEIKSNLDKFVWLKLGYSNNLDLRIKRYNLRSDCTVTKLLVIPISSGLKAIKFEKQIHSYFLKSRLESSHMKSYHVTDGYTECYPTDLKTDILAILRSIHRKENK